MPNYDSEKFEPPAPLAKIILRNIETGAELPDVPMLLDTGADTTLLPKEIVRLLGIEMIADRQYQLIGFDGSTSFAEVVEVALVFQGKVFRGQFLLIEQEWGILGRNILNALALLFDGPRLVWDVNK